MIILVALEDELSKDNLVGCQVEYTGVGKINAAIKTTEAIRKYSPELIINLSLIHISEPTRPY